MRVFALMGRAALLASVAFSSSSASMVWAAEAVQTRQQSFDIAQQSLPQALDAFARASGWQVGYTSALTAGLSSRVVSGVLDPAQALTQLLQGTGLTWRSIGANTVTLETVAADGAMRLDPVTVQGQAVAANDQDSARGPVRGYVAKSSAAGTKTDTPLIETAQSISVVTREQMDAIKATNLSDALAYTPSVVTQPGSFSRMADDVMIRGFNVADGNSGMLRDGMKLQANVYAGSQEPYGLERLDVVRGAASVLYGQLSPGGVVNAITKRPTATPLREIVMEGGSYERKQLAADFSDSLTKDGRVAYRLTMMKRDSDTFIDHFNDDRVYLAPSLALKPTEDTTLTLQASYQESKSRFAAPLLAAGTLYPTDSGFRLSRGAFIGEPDFDRYENVTTALGYDIEHRFNPALQLRHALRHVEASGDWDYMQARTISGSTLTRRASIRDENSQVWTSDTSLEVKLGDDEVRHTLLAGLDYAWQEYDTYRYTRNVSSLDLASPSYGRWSYTGTLSADSGFTTTGSQIGYYLQDQIKVDDRWAVMLGLRRDRAKAETVVHRTRATINSDDGDTTGRAGLVYLAPNGLAPYVSYSQSFQPVNTASGVSSSSGDPFQPTTGEQMEVGLRYQPPATRTMLSAALYRLTQQNVLTIDPADNTSYIQTGEVRSDGLELELKTELAAGLNVLAVYSYTDARTTKSTTASDVGMRVASVPYNAVSVWADYALADIGLPGLTVGGGVRYIGSTRATSLTSNVPGYSIFDAMVRYELGARSATLEGWTVALNAKNLLDREYVSCTTSSGCRYGDPLTVVASLALRW